MYKVVFSVLVFVAVANAKLSCKSCDKAGDRQSRTGCKFFCLLDHSQVGYLTRDSVLDGLLSKMDLGEAMSYEKFTSEVMENVGFCMGEANELFVRISTIGSESQDSLTAEDFGALYDFIEGIAGEEIVTMEAFEEVYDLVYDAVKDETCRDG